MIPDPYPHFLNLLELYRREFEYTERYFVVLREKFNFPIEVYSFFDFLGSSKGDSWWVSKQPIRLYPRGNSYGLFLDSKDLLEPEDVYLFRPEDLSKLDLRPW